MRFWISLALLLGTLPSPGQDGPSKAVCEVRGVVVRASDDEPLPRAKVKLGSLTGRRDEGSSERERESTSAEDGSFEFRDLPCGRYALSAERTGFLRADFGERGPDRPGAPLTLTAGEKLRPVKLRLTAAAAITGRVVDADGEPVSRMQVVALRMFRRGGKPQEDSVAFAQTNDLGEYRLHTLPPARYYVRAGGSEGNGAFGWSMNFAAPQAGKPARLVNVPTYFPSATQLEQASPLELKASDEVRADIQLQRAAALAIRGRVIGGGKQTQVIALARESEAKTAQVRPDGSFEIADLIPGEYVLMAMSPAEGSSDESDWAAVRRAFQQVSVTNSDLEGVTITLEAAGRFSLAGKVVSRDPKIDLSKVFIQAAQDDDTVELSARNYFGLRQPAFARAKRDGTFVLKNLAPGEYRVGVYEIGRVGGSWYPESVRLGSIDVLTSGFRITNANPQGTLEIVLNDAAGSITGTVTDADGQPLTGVTAVAVPAAPLRKTVNQRRGTTDQNGRFLLESLRPGQYTVLAVDGSEWTVDFGDADFLARYESQGKRVTVGERQTVSVELRSITVEPE
ncbi:MAG TPA: carboxypeptidase-like regulatory domain-containing protein [Terriglobales bacterium]|nr:carboxypeptidase-like regulatory domain-containing protein [Terriglobales bacterium]